MYSGLTSYSKTMVLTECWGISKIPGGYVAGCGQGQEGCKNSQVDQSVVDQCKKDPRGAWRGTAVAVGMDGAIAKLWQPAGLPITGCPEGTYVIGNPAGCHNAHYRKIFLLPFTSCRIMQQPSDIRNFHQGVIGNFVTIIGNYVTVIGNFGIFP